MAASVAASERKPTSRPNAAARGYGYRWQKYATRFLMNHPLCGRCRDVGKVEPSRCVDHIKPVQSASDLLFWTPANHQALCLACHSVKTQTEDKGKGRLVR